MATPDDFKPGRAQVMDLVAYLDALGGPPDTLFSWQGGERGPDGVITMPWVEYSQPVLAFTRDVGRLGFVIVFDWSEWQDTAKELQFERLHEATLLDCAKLLTLHIRKDRFVEGHLAEALSQGWIQDILWRMKEIIDRDE